MKHDDADGQPARVDVPDGFEAPHVVWLRLGGNEFRKRHYPGPDSSYYQSEYWIEVRAAILSRDKHGCFRCGQVATQVHHLHYRHAGEDHLHPESLVSVCFPCHGLVEYARHAEDLASVIRRRTLSCQGFADGRRGFDDQIPVKVYSRLLEYRSRLNALQERYANNISHRDRPKITDTEAKELMRDKRAQDAAEFHRQAHSEIETWPGTDREKAVCVVPLLKRMEEECLEFAQEVLKPSRK